MEKEIFLIQVCDLYEVHEKKFVVGRKNADIVYASMSPPKGMSVTMNKANVAFDGELVRGEFIKQTEY